MSATVPTSFKASSTRRHAAFGRAGVPVGRQQVRPEMACFAESETSTAPDAGTEIAIEVHKLVPQPSAAHSPPKSHTTRIRTTQAARPPQATRTPATTLTEAPPAETEVAPAAEAPVAAADDGTWVSVIPPEELPKGVRKEVSVDGKSILLFWYRNQIYAIASRSPAEGAYSEGFIKAKFTQEYGIICPSTGSIFSLKDGSILEWYPSNPVLRSITPQTGALPIYPVKLTQDAIQVSLESATASGPSDRGGADTSLENNNVFAVEPKSYVVGSEADADEKPGLSTALTLTVAISAFAIVSTAGTATALYYEDFVLLGGFWAFMLGVGAFFTFQQQQWDKQE